MTADAVITQEIVMKALQFDRFGSPDAIVLREVPDRSHDPARSGSPCGRVV